MNETELVERCGKGDNLARKQLYERYAGQLMEIGRASCRERV